jgi:AcrR family transcriptional regulator
MSNQSPARRRRAVQSRAEATRRAIREASLRILRDEGPRRLTSNRIVEVAGARWSSVS